MPSVSLQHKVLSGPRTLAAYLLIFLVVLLAVSVGAYGEDMALREQALRATLGATMIISLLAFLERHKPDPASG